jgi:hypothetical protein
VEIEKNGGQRHLRTCELHQLQHCDMILVKERLQGKLDLHTLEFCVLSMQTSSVGGGGMWAIQVKFLFLPSLFIMWRGCKLFHLAD